jgi:ABC-type dipeptide/oligopeptide/nickel transport system ATPase component
MIRTGAAPAYGAAPHWEIGLGQHWALAGDRERHVYIVGKSGSGKSTVIFNLAMHDIMAAEGVAVIDPHGDLAKAVADCIPPDRTHSVCYLDAADPERPVGFNPLANISPERHALAASGIVSAFKHLWWDSCPHCGARHLSPTKAKMSARRKMKMSNPARSTPR